MTGACIVGGMHGRGHLWWGGMHGFVGVHGRGACMAECILVSTESSSPAVLAFPPCRTTKHLKYGCALEINVGS